MTDFVRRHPMMAGLIALFVLFLVTSTFAIVPETRQGIVVRFGKPVRIINRYEAGQQFGSPGPQVAKNKFLFAARTGDTDGIVASPTGSKSQPTA